MLLRKLCFVMILDKELRKDFWSKPRPQREEALPDHHPMDWPCRSNIHLSSFRCSLDAGGDCRAWGRRVFEVEREWGLGIRERQGDRVLDQLID